MNGFACLGSYVRMMEETEYSFLRSRNLNVVLSDERGTLGFPRLSARVEIITPAHLNDKMQINMELLCIDGKQIVYGFNITDEQSQPVAMGQFQVACCRFPDDGPPFAVVMPEFILNRLLIPTEG
jgi:acyl-CoA thioesterase FadM